MYSKNLIDIEAMTTAQIDKLVKKAKKIMQSPADYRHACDGKILATLFYEPSTRTQMSFQTAYVISGYADIIAMRHPVEGTAMAASLYSDIPVINCGDGGHLHPTQTLTDIVTLSCEKGRLDNLKIGVCGDLLNGRTVHSLIKALVKYENNSFTLISTPELGVPLYIIDILEKHGCKYTISHSLADAVKDLDMLYMTRIQRERFKSEEDYLSQKDVFVLDKEKLANARDDMIILHPLPRVNEITVDIDDDPRAMYFKQAQYGMFGRMALILLLLQDEDFVLKVRDREICEHRCKNPKCVTQTEEYLPNYSYEKLGMHMCDYCDKRID